MAGGPPYSVREPPAHRFLQDQGSLQPNCEAVSGAARSWRRRCQSAGTTAGRRLGAVALGVTPRCSCQPGRPLPKVEATGKYGAKVVLEGSVYDEAHAAPRSSQSRPGRSCAPLRPPGRHRRPGDPSPLEILEAGAGRALDHRAVGGGGLVSASRRAAKALRPDLRIIGVEPVGAATLSSSLEVGEVVALPDSRPLPRLAAKRAGASPSSTSAACGRRRDRDRGGDRRGPAAHDRACPPAVEPAGSRGRGGGNRRRSPITSGGVILSGATSPVAAPPGHPLRHDTAGRYFSFRTRLRPPRELQRPVGRHRAGGRQPSSDQHRARRAHSSLGGRGGVDPGRAPGPDHIKELIARLEDDGYEVTAL